MIVYIKGKTRVKGVQNKDVYYVGCVESDGYIYFNDSVSYRIPTPATLREEADVNVTDVQIWYTVRNCWIRANYFTQLKVYGVDFEHIYNRISTLETKVATLEQKVATLESKVATLESKVATLESKVSTLESKVSTLESKVATLESKVSTLETKVYNLENTVADHEVRIIACEAQIQGLNTRLVTAENDISNLKTRMTSAETGINNNRNSIIAINSVLGYLPNLIGQNTTLEDYLRTKFNNYDTSINNLANTQRALVTTVTDHSNRISALENRINHAYTGSGGGTLDMETILNTLADGLEGVLLDISEISARDVAHKNAINELGHKALGASYNNTDGNGVTLLAVYNKVNTIISNLNYLIDGQTVVGHVSSLPSTSIWTNWNNLIN